LSFFPHKQIILAKLIYLTDIYSALFSASEVERSAQQRHGECR